MLGEQVAFETALAGQQSGFELNDLIELPIATLGDFTSVLGNAITFGQAELETESFLAGLGFEDSAEYYAENRGLVEGLSFIGGLFVPLGAAMKGVQLAKSGRVLAPRFNKFKQWEDQIKYNKDQALELLKSGNEFTEAYRLNRWKMRADIAKTELTQAAFYEASILGALSHHAWMDDYDAYDFLFSAAIGSLSAPLRMYYEGSQIKKGAQALFNQEVEALEEFAPLNFPKATGKTKIATEEDITQFPIGDRLALRFLNYERQQNAGTNPLSPIATRQLDSFKTQEQLNILGDLKEIMDPTLATKSQNAREVLNREHIVDPLVGGSEWETDAITDVARYLNEHKTGLSGVREVKPYARTRQTKQQEPLSPTELDEPIELSTGGRRFTNSKTLLKRELYMEFGKDFIDKLEANKVLTIKGEAAELAVLRDQFTPRELSGFQGVNFSQLGRTVLFGNNIKPGQAKGVIMHEIGVHYGFRKMVGDKTFSEILYSMGARVEKGNMVGTDDARVASAVHRVPENTHSMHMKAALAAGLDPKKAQIFGDQKVMEETLAYFIEENPNSTFAQRIFTQIKMFMRNQLGFKLELSNDDLISLATASLRKAAKEQRRAVKGKNGAPSFSINDAIQGTKIKSSVVFDPFFNAMMTADEARRVERFADTEKVIPRVKTEKAFKPARFVFGEKFNPAKVSTKDADGAYLIAQKNWSTPLIPLVDRTTGKVAGAINDLPRLQAAALEGAQVKWADKIVEASDILIDEKLKAITSLAKTKKLGMEEIALYTNTPLKKVENVLAANFKKDPFVSDGIEDWVIYNGTGKDTAQFLRRGKLNLTGDDITPKKVMQPVVKMDRQHLNELNDQFVENRLLAAAEYNADIGEFTRDILLGSTFKEIRDDIFQLGAPAQGRSGVFVSADHALRDQGLLGSQITSLGTTVSKMLDRFSAEQIAKISPAAAEVKNDPGAVAQFAEVFQQWHSQPRLPEAATYDGGRIILRQGDPEHEIPPLFLKDAAGNPIQIAPNSPLDNFFQKLFTAEDSPTDYLRQIRNATRSLNGQQTIPRSVYFPYATYNDRFVGYVIDKANPANTKAFIARSADELESMRTDLEKKFSGGAKRVVLRGEDDWNAAHSYARVNGASAVADANMFKSGTGVLTNGADPQIIDDFLQSVSSDVYRGYRALLQESQSEVFSRLDSISKQLNAGNLSSTQSRRFANDKNNALIAKRSLLNTQGIDDVPFFQKANDNFGFALNLALNNMKRLWTTNINGVPTQVGYDAFTRGIAQSQNSPSEIPTFMEWARANTDHYQNMADDFVGAASALTVAFTLKIAELAHGAATVVSAPILMGSEIVNAGAPLKHLYQGFSDMVKAGTDSNSWQARVLERAQDLGYASAEIAELTRNMANLHASPGKVDKFLESSIVKRLSYPTEKSESLVREFAYMTGYRMGREKYGPNVSEEAIEHFANAFTKRTMGNYTSGQRPVMFQGTLGHVGGLFQTYMLTFAQNGFRFLGEGDRKAMGMMLAGQIGAFGFSSLPGYDFFNQNLATHIFEDKMSLENAALRFGSHNAAEIALYGLPSWMTQMALTTRGDLSIQSPVTFDSEAGVSFGPAILSAAQQLTQFGLDVGGNIANTMKAQGGPLDYGRAITQAVGTQNLSRPAARLAEIVQGYSTNQSGRVVELYEPDDYLNLTMLMKLGGARPLKEHVIRQANYMNSYFNSADRESRRGAVEALKLYATGRTDYSLGAIARNYFDNGGTGSGFKSSLNQALIEREGLEAALANDNDYPAIMDVIENYYLQ